MKYKFDLNKTLGFIWNSPKRNDLILKWTGFVFAFVVLFTVLYFLLFGVVAAVSDNTVLLITLGGTIAGLMMILIFGYTFYINGYTYKVFEHILDSKSEVKLEDIKEPETNWTMKIGGKIFGVDLAYIAVPYFLLYSVMFLMIFNDDDSLVLILTIIYYGIYAIVMIWQMIYGYCFRPIVFFMAKKHGFKYTLNPINISREFTNNIGLYLKIGGYQLLIAILWLIVYIVSIVSIIICIGLVAVPVALGLQIIMMVYLFPYIFGNALKEIK